VDLFEKRKIYSVYEITSEIKKTLDLFGILWIQGEISNFKRHTSGHMYFALKDDRAQLKAAFFRNSNLYLKIKPEDGLEVLVRGRISVYEPRGDYQVIVEFMEPVGLGSLQLAFEQLKEKLRKEGLFDEAHKKPLPLLPQKIGIVTSPTGAAIRDMLRILARRNASLHVFLYPAKVQGEGAAREIAEGVRYFNSRQDIDVIIVGRGGGSIEDLWAFNEEIVARAIFESRIPVISAVGHEVDFTISVCGSGLRFGLNMIAVTHLLAQSAFVNLRGS
jgi:exodeoxyribonuclease VII large subunit